MHPRHPSIIPPTRVVVDRFGDTHTVHTGPIARAHRRQIEREQAQALARYDADPSPENKAAFEAIASPAVARRGYLIGEGGNG